MKIWYQSYSPMGFDPKWKPYEEALKRRLKESARPDTQIDLFGVEVMSPRMIESDYIKFLHVYQVVEKSMQAERAGYDAFVLGGTLDPGAPYLRELLDIPVAFIGETSFYAACLLAPKFSFIAPSQAILHHQTRLAESYSLGPRLVPGAYMGRPLLDIVTDMDKNPKGLVEAIRKAASGPIERGAGALVPGFGGLTSFLADQGVADIDGVPIVDGVAVVVKMAEMLVDLKKMGIKRGKKGLDISPVSKADLLAARKMYGVE